MRNILFILAALIGFGAFAQTNIPTRQMLADTNGVVKFPTNITQVRIGGTVFTNLLGFGLSVTNGELSVDTTQLPAGGGGGGSGTVTNVAASTTVSGLGFAVTSPTVNPSISLTGTVAVASGGTGATDASGARTALSLVPGTDVQAYDADLAAIAALANSGIIVRTGSGTVSARTITGDTEAVVSNGDGVSGNPTLSIGAAIARTADHLTESEASALYQGTNSVLTATVAGTAVSVAQTNAVSMGAPVLYAGSTNIAEHVATKAPLASPALTGDPTVPTATAGDNDTSAASTAFLALRIPNIAYDATSWNGNTNAASMDAVRDKIESLSTGGSWDGTPIASATITNLTVESVNGVPYIDTGNGDFFNDGWNLGAAGTAVFQPHFLGGAVSSGTYFGSTGSTTNIFVAIYNSSSGANSGYVYSNGGSGIDLAGGDIEFGVGCAFAVTNGIVGRYGFLDVFNGNEAVDGAYFRLINGYLQGVLANNSSYSYTTTSNQIATSSTQFYRLATRVNTGGTAVTFTMTSVDGSGVRSTNWSDTITATIPSGSSRLTGYGFIGTSVPSGGPFEVMRIDYSYLKHYRRFYR